MLCNLHPKVKRLDAQLANDKPAVAAYPISMGNVSTVHKGRQPRRPHFIAEWAELRGLSQADIAREIGADKGLVSRWFADTTPGIEWQARLAELFGCDPSGLFRHPDDDWLTKFFADRQREEIERIKATLEIAFPRKRA